MQFIGKIDKEIYKCITEDIVTDEVVLTDAQKKHIIDRHPEAYDEVVNHFVDVLKSPDYIIRDKHPNTGLIVKRLEGDKHTQIVLRVQTSEDKVGYKNSIISSWTISDRRLRSYLRNKEILYKAE